MVGGIYTFFRLLPFRRWSLIPFHMSVDRTWWLISNEHNTGEVMGRSCQNQVIKRLQFSSFSLPSTLSLILCPGPPCGEACIARTWAEAPVKQLRGTDILKSISLWITEACQQPCEQVWRYILQSQPDLGTVASLTAGYSFIRHSEPERPS